MMQIRVLIVDDHAVVRKGIQMLISTEPTIQIIGEAVDGQDAVRQVKTLQPDIVLMDLVFPQEDGIEAIVQIKHDCPNIKIIVLTTFEDNVRINAAMNAGADGYLLKDADGEALLQAIQAVQQGEMPLHPRIARYLFRGGMRQDDTNGFSRLTEREKEVLQLVAKGLSNKAVAQALSLSEGTIKVYLSNILGKLSVSSRTEAAVWASQSGLVTPDTVI
jgi:DNA-binding NarL/FixJ family response regulator